MLSRLVASSRLFRRYVGTASSQNDSLVKLNKQPLPGHVTRNPLLDLSKPIKEHRVFLRNQFKAFWPEYEIHSMGVFGTKDRSSFFHDSVKTILSHHCVPVKDSFDRMVFLSDKVYHIRMLTIPNKFDIAIALTSLNQYEARIELGIFETDSESASVIAALDIGWTDRAGKIIEIPVKVQRALKALEGGSQTGNYKFKYCL